MGVPMETKVADASRKRRWSRILAGVAVGLILLDVIRLFLLPPSYQEAFMDGFEIVVFLVCILACGYAAARSSPLGKGLWLITAAFFVFMAATDLHDFLLDISLGTGTLFSSLEFLGWSSYLPLALLVFYPLEKDGRPDWTWLTLLDYLLVTVAAGLAYFRLVDLPRILAGQSWTAIGHPDLVRNVLLSGGLLLRSGVDPASQARAFYRRVGGVFAAVTILRVAFPGYFNPIFAVSRPALWLLLGILAVRWENVADDRPEPAGRRGALRLVLSLFAAATLLLVLVLALSTPAPYHRLMDVCAGVCAVLFILRSSLAERSRHASKTKLRSSEQDYRVLFESAVVPIVIFEPESERILQANAAACELYGVAPGTLVGSSLKEFTKDIARGEEQIRELLRTGTCQRFESVHRTRKGREIDVLVSSSVIQYRGRKAILSFNRDVTERQQVVEALRESEEKFRSLVSNIPDVSWTLDAHQRFVFISSNIETLSGYTPDEIYERGAHLYLSSLHPDDVPKVREAFRALFVEGQPFDVEVRAQRKDGEWRWLQHRALATYEKNGVRYADGLLSDITERKRAEEALRQSEARFRNYFEQPLLGTAITSPEKGWIAANDRICEILGYSLQELKETDWAKLTHPDDLETDVIQFNRVLTGEIDGYSLDKRFIRKDSEIIWTSIAVRCVRKFDGTVDYICAVMEDITERKRAAEALLQSEAKLKEALLAAQMGAWEWTAATDTVTWDENLYRIAGREPKLPAPSYQEHPQIYAPESWERLKRAVENALATGTPYELDLEMVRPDGSKRWLIGRGEAVRDASGHVTQLRGTVQDITERKRAEAALRSSEERLRELVETAEAVVWEADAPTLRITFMSQGVEKILGYPAEQWLQTPGFWAAHLHPEDREGALACEREVTEKGKPCSVEYRMTAADGRVLWFRDFMHAVAGPEGKVERLRGVMVEISESKRAEEALRESELELREAHRLARLGNWSMDLKTGQATWSDEVYRMFGLDPSLLSLPYSEHGRLFTPESWRRLTTELEEAVRTGTPYELELETVRADGSRGWILDRGEPVRNADGAITHLRGIAMDITGRKRAEEALRESEERFRSLVENATVGIYRTTPQGRILMANPALVKMLGYKNFKELAARNLEEEGFEPGYPRKAFRDRMAQDSEVRDLEEAWTRRDGSVIFVRESARAFHSEDGKIMYYDGIVEDVTERKQVEAEKARLVTAIEQSAEAAVITNISGDIEYVNPAFTRITGYSREEVLGKNPRILKSGKQDPAFYQQLWATILKGEIWQGEIINRRKDGSLYTLQMSVAPVRGEHGKITHFIATEQDITARKLLEQQLIQAQKIEAVGRLAGGVAHDFNNLLTIINGYAELLTEQTSAEDPRRDHLKEILMAGERAAGLTRQLLAFSRRQVLEPRVLDLNSVLTEVEKMLRRLIGEDVELVTSLKPDLGHVKVDPGQIEQVVMNLAVNARDAMPEGGKLYLETSNVDVDEDYARSHPSIMPGKFVMVAVSDTGCGMDAETQTHIFEPFFTTKEKGHGTGLGLATVYGIVKQSGGFIWVYSEPGQGSTFKIYFPCVEEAASTTEPADFAAKPAKGAETVLVVEDEEGVRSLVCKTLKSKGYKVLEATGAAQALQIVEQLTEPIHLLLTDVVMPQAGGKELAKRLSTLRPGTKVLYMSGYTDDAIVRHGILEVGTFFLQKPFAPDALVRKVREVLDRKPETLQ